MSCWYNCCEEGAINVKINLDRPDEKRRGWVRSTLLLRGFLDAQLWPDAGRTVVLITILLNRILWFGV